MLDKSPPTNLNLADNYKNIDWTFIGNTGASFRSHVAMQKSNDIIIIKPRLFFLLFYILAIFISVSLSAFFYPSLDEIITSWPLHEKIFFSFLIVAFFLGGIYSLIYNLRNYKYFNKKNNSYSVSNKIECQLSDITAIQILYTRGKARGITKDSTGNENAYDYQINLILNTNKRINVVSHGGLKGIKIDAKKIGEFLKVPVLDGINYDYINNTYIPEY